jgi:hypothetical protein
MTLERARQQLGGRAASHGRAGEIVAVGKRVGVVLCSDAKGCDVWVGNDRTQRVPSRQASPVLGATTPELDAVAADARCFAGLAEGDDVLFDGSITGRLIEKCRFGALVARADGKIFAVGFRRFTPTPRATN